MKHLKNKLFGIMICAVMLLVMLAAAVPLFASTEKAQAATKYPDKITIYNQDTGRSVSLNSSTPYYKNGPDGTLGMLLTSAANGNYNAYYNPQTGILELKNYNGPAIKWDSDSNTKDVTIKVASDSHITNTGSEDIGSRKGIYGGSYGNAGVDIQIESGKKLTITSQTCINVPNVYVNDYVYTSMGNKSKMKNPGTLNLVSTFVDNTAYGYGVNSSNFTVNGNINLNVSQKNLSGKQKFIGVYSGKMQIDTTGTVDIGGYNFDYAVETKTDKPVFKNAKSIHVYIDKPVNGRTVFSKATDMSAWFVAGHNYTADKVYYKYARTGISVDTDSIKVNGIKAKSSQISYVATGEECVVEFKFKMEQWFSDLWQSGRIGFDIGENMTAVKIYYASGNPYDTGYYTTEIIANWSEPATNNVHVKVKFKTVSGNTYTIALDMPVYITSNESNIMETLRVNEVIKVRPLTAIGSINIALNGNLVNGEDADNAVQPNQADTSLKYSITDRQPWFEANGDYADIFVGGEEYSTWFRVSADDGVFTANTKVNTRGIDRIEKEITQKGDMYITIYVKAKYRVSYNKNGGSGTMNSVIADKNQKITLSQCGFEAPANKVFKAWSIDGKEYAPGAEYTVNSNATIKAVWIDKQYALTVKNGTGSGSYAAGATVKIKANNPPAGKVFDKWVASDGATVANASSAETTVKMPSKAATVEATYKDAPKYTVTVTNGNGGGQYAEGENVTLVANADTTAMRFKAWEVVSGSVTLANYYSRTTTFKMPAHNVTINAVFESKPAVTYKVTITGGSGSGEYAANETVTIKANAAPAGKIFDKWVIESGSVTLANANSESTSFKMPASAVKIRATYKDKPVERFGVTVTNGSGSGEYAANETVTIKANEAPAGKIFDKWVIESGSVTLANANSESTSFKMPASAVKIRATYKDKPAERFGVTVIDGSGSGEYAANETVTIKANKAPDGKIFDKWVIESGSVTLANANSESTTFKMPASAVKIRATYKDKPVERFGVTVTDGSGSGEHAANETVTIKANAAPAGKMFDKWIVESGDVVLEGAENEETSFVMPTCPVTVRATYKDIPVPEYTLTVKNGNGSGEYKEGATVTITVNDAPEGKEFDKWEVISGNIGVDDLTEATLIFTMPAENVEIVAVYRDKDVTHNVNTDKWESDANGHWHSCADCADKHDKAAHSFEWKIDKEATETEKGSKHEECGICGYKKDAVEIPAIEKPQEPENNKFPVWLIPVIAVICIAIVLMIVLLAKKKKKQ